MRIPAIFVGLLVTMASDSLGQTKDWPYPPVPIYVTSVGAVDGRTDPSKDHQASVKDISDELKKHSKVVNVVLSQPDSQIVVTVLGRERSDIIINQGIVGPWREVYVKAKLSYKTTNAELKGTGWADAKSAPSSGSGMKAAAREVAKQVHEWVVQNRDTFK